jgi:hypothetical protein
VKPSAAVLTANELLDLFLDGLDADQRLSPKTRQDYRVYAQNYVRKPLGNRSVRDVTPELILSWQRRLLAEGGAPPVGVHDFWSFWRRTPLRMSMRTLDLIKFSWACIAPL